MNLKILFLLLNSLLIVQLKASGSDSLRSKPKTPSKKISVLFTAGYRLPVNQNLILNSGAGLYLEGGLNFGPLISKDIVLGVFGGIALKDRFWSTSFSEEFVRDYENAINKEQSGLDSAIIFTSAERFRNAKGNDVSMPGCETSAFHSYSLYYGIQFNLPLKYFSGIKIYKGTTRSHYRGDEYMITKQRGYNNLELRRKMHGAEVCILNFEINRGIKRSDNISLSVYYETCDFYNSTLYFSDDEITRSIWLKHYTSSSFLRKYRSENSWGMKLVFQIR